MQIFERARTNPRYAVALCATATLFALLVCWAIYISTKHGPAIGAGVLISGTTLLTATALAATPFVATGMLVTSRVRERRNGAGDKADQVTDKTFPC